MSNDEQRPAEGEAPPDPEPGAAAEAPPAEGVAPDVPQNRRQRRAAAAQERRGELPATSPAAAIPARPGPAPFGLDAGERVDDALARASDRGFRFLKRHFNTIQWVLVGGAALWIGREIYLFRGARAAASRGEELGAAVAAELGKVGAAAGAEPARDARGSLDTRLSFPDEAARLAAAEAGYQKVITSQAGQLAADLARLGLAGVLLDQGKPDEARAAYEAVLSSDLARQDPEARGRAHEGVALALEAKGDRDGALKRYQELENQDLSGFTELAQYQAARLLYGKGDTAAAAERLKKLVEKLGKEAPKPGDPPNALLEQARELLGRVDPRALPPPSGDEALQKLLRDFQSKLPPGVTQNAVPVPPAPPAAP